MRELRNILERALLLTDDDCIDVTHLPLLQPRSAATASIDPNGDIEPLDLYERHFLRQVLATSSLGRRELAQRLGISDARVVS